MFENLAHARQRLFESRKERLISSIKFWKEQISFHEEMANRAYLHFHNWMDPNGVQMPGSLFKSGKEIKTSDFTNDYITDRLNHFNKCISDARNKAKATRTKLKEFEAEYSKEFGELP